MSQSKTVLIVEDNDTTAKILIHTFKGLGYTVMHAHDADEADTMSQHTPPALALIDVLLPGTDGIGLMRAIKNNPVTQQTRVFAMSAGNRHEIEPQVKAAGCDGYISKPFSLEELRKLFG